MDLKIKKEGKSFVVVVGNFNEEVAKFNTFDQARALLGKLGVKDAEGPLHRGATDLYGNELDQRNIYSRTVSALMDNTDHDIDINDEYDIFFMGKRFSIDPSTQDIINEEHLYDEEDSTYDF